MSRMIQFWVGKSSGASIYNYYSARIIGDDGVFHECLKSFDNEQKARDWITRRIKKEGNIPSEVR